MSHRPEGDRQVTADPDSVDDSACTVLHVDMDAFFAMVEVRRRPELRGREMMVAGMGGRGVVLSASYEARRHGITSAMPTGKALALCPGIIVVPPDRDAYSEASRSVMSIFGDVTPLVEPLSVDEAFLDVSGARRRFGRPGEIARRLRDRINGELGLTATVGVASTKFIAKLASGLAKPDGLLIVPPTEVLALLHPLPVRALWGVGPRTAERLESFGIGTIGEIAALDVAQLVRMLGSATGTRLHDLSWGRDERTVQVQVAESSIGAETTFAVDSTDSAYLARQLLALTERTARRARETGVRGRTVSIKVRFEDFTTITRSATLATPTDMSRTVYRAARELFDRVRSSSSGSRRIRLLGVRLEGLVPGGDVVEQLELGAADPRPGWREAEGAIDRAVARFGAAAIRPAALLERPTKS
jgi:DNA polymerase-4